MEARQQIEWELDEESGSVVGAPPEELANWWPQVQKQFDQLAPDLVLQIVVPVDDKAVVALLIDAKNERAAKWYSSYGAVPLADAPLSLLLPLATVQVALETSGKL